MILFVETSWEEGSLALLLSSRQGSGCEHVSWEKKSSHSENLTLEFQNLLQKADAQISDLKGICVNVGPGSFTGVRVGLSFALSLAYSRKLPITPLNTLELMAYQQKNEGSILVALPAIKGHFYVGGYRLEDKQLTEILTPRSQSTKELETLKTQYLHFVKGELRTCRPSAQGMYEFFRSPPRQLVEVSWKSIKPLYLRRSEAEEKLYTGILKPLYEESESQVERVKPKQSD